MKVSKFLAVSVATVLSAAPAFADEAAKDQPAVSAAEKEIAAPAAKAEKRKSAWQIKPRWRLQYDIADIDGPAGLRGTGKFEDIRRTQLGVDIKMPNGFSARVEGEFSADPIEFVDAYIAWDRKGVNVTAGQQKPLTPLDDMTSDVNSSFMERAAFSTAFGYTRRAGVSAGVTKGDFAINAGVFTDPLILLNDVKTNSVSADFRTYWSPKFGATKVHLAAAYHWRDMGDLSNSSTRYRQRPLVRITDTRYISTAGIIVEKEHKYGFEAAAVNGRFHGAAEVHWLKAERPGFADPTFFGGYAEAGVFLTNDSRPLKAGVFGGIKPKKPLGKGGVGALQLNVRYDYLDLNSQGVRGGKQDGYLASVIWTPIENIRLLFNYARLDYTGAAIAVAGDRDYAVDVIGVRGQLTF